MGKNTTFEICGHAIAPGSQKVVDIPLAPMATHGVIEMPVHIINGKQDGPVLFVSAAIHGDEINGVEIIRRLLKLKQITRLKGTLIAIPIVNVHGFINHSRYLPDGRDLNRSFPGSSKGSLAARIANTFLQEIICQCTHGIDLHTGARHRENLPQIRADLSNPAVKEMAEAFGAPAIIDSKVRDGSLREVAGDEGIPVVLYEAGEALRFNEVSIRGGVRGVANIMRLIGMLPKLKRKEEKLAMTSSNTSWVRAPSSGVMRALVPLGAKAAKGSVLAVIADPLGESEIEVLAPEDGLVIGRTNLPLVYEGDALFHLAYFGRKIDAAVEKVENFHVTFEPEMPIEAPPESTDGPIQ